MNIWKKLLTATAGAVFLSLKVVYAVKAVTLASASLGSNNTGIGFTIDNNQFLGWRFQAESTLQVTAIGGNLSKGSGSLFGIIVALNSFNKLPQGEPFLPEEILAITTFDSSKLFGDVEVPLSVRLAPGYYGLVFGSGLFGATGSSAMPYNNIDLPGSSYFVCWNCTTEKGTWSNSQTTNIRFVVEGDDGPPISQPSAVPEPSSVLGLFAFSILGASYMLSKRKA